MLSSLERLDRRWSAELAGIEVVVADVPDADEGASASGATEVPLGRAEPARSNAPGRIVVHRRAVEARAAGRRERETLVHAVLVQQLAALLGLEPGTVDPDADDLGGDDGSGS